MLQILSPGKITYYYKVQSHLGVFSIYRVPKKTFFVKVAYF
jgi:hypothetical protein